jgi:hypothetical protein
MMSAQATWLSNLGVVFARVSLLQVIEVIITFYLLFHFLRNRLEAKVKMVPWPPLANPKTRQLLPRVAKTIHAIGPVTYLCRPQCSFRPLGVRRPRVFCLPMLNADGGGYRSR